MKLGRFEPPSAAQTVLCLVCGVVVAGADNAATVATLGPFDARFVVRALGIGLLLLVVFLIGERLMKAPGKTRRVDTFPVLERYRSLPFAGRLLVPSAVMLACWTPVIVIMYPGTIWYDTGDQIAQWYGIEAYGQPAGSISSHHPLLDTIVFGSLARLGDALAGDYRSALAVYAVVQCVVMCVELTGVCLYVARVGREGAAHMAAVALFAFFTLFPALVIFMMSIVKDSLHLLFLVPWLVLFAETARTRLEALHSPRFAVGFVALSVLTALTTMTGLYVTILSLCCLPLTRAGRADRLRALAVASVTALITMMVFPAAVRSAFDVEYEDQNQLLVVPMQMTARYALDHPGDVTDTERAAIDRVNHVPFEDMAFRYHPYLADPVIQYSLRDPSGVGEYLRAWAVMGLRHPDSYANAFAALESGWFSLQRTPMNVTDRGIRLDELRGIAGQAAANRIRFQIADAISPAFARMTRYHANNANSASRSRAYALWGFWQSTPVLRVLTLTALWTFLLPAFLLFRLLRPPYGRMLARCALPAAYAAPLVWSLLSLLANAISVPLKPTASRYMLWALVVVPFMLALCASERSESTCQMKGNSR
ncbi:DUF6020 family protein [Bifidobacterium biavatii]|uniref:Transmembrane protein n=1 Tax=Bifidobacterium biavatii DSM 23969 TaxID=1437608 RepID=A0A086ZVF9_9BIFI|nr:DUF6020 family protein [Bifidobacterium biavatii]KFI50509.1 hypothetical protein BBIA_1732 [Bifidobacterium biavatii DSM 23969]